MKLNELLGTEFPFIQGGMANIATGEFAAAVSNAGALGLIGSGGMNADSLRENIRRCKALTDKPFGVNLMLMNPAVDEMAKVVIEEGVKVVTTGAGNPGKYIPAWKEAGIIVIPVVAAAVLAKRLTRYGIDAVIAEGTESGGHVGEMTTMACLLVSEECPIHPNYKQALLKASDTDTIVTGRTTGAPVRVLKNKMAKEYIRMEKENIPLAEREKLTLGSLRRAVFEGDTEMGSLMAGQVAGQLHEIRPVRAILEELYADYQSCVKGMVNDL